MLLRQAAHGHLGWWPPALALFGLLLTSGYFLWAMRRLLMGPLHLPQIMQAPLADVHGFDAFLLWATVALAIFLGLYPQALLSLWDGLL